MTADDIPDFLTLGALPMPIEFEIRGIRPLGHCELARLLNTLPVNRKQRRNPEYLKRHAARMRRKRAELKRSQQ